MREGYFYLVSIETKPISTVGGSLRYEDVRKFLMTEVGNATVYQSFEART